MVAMLERPTMRLVPGTHPAAEKTGAERRLFPRKEMHCWVQGRRLDHTIEAHRNPHLSLSLRDISLGGLSAIVQEPVKSGETISVFFPPEGSSRGWDAKGKVLRCEPSGMGYRLAVEFDPLPAAA